MRKKNKTKNTPVPPNMPPSYLYYQSAIWQQERLTICLKYRPTAWPGKSSRRGSSLKWETREKFRHSEHYQHKDRGMCWLPPLLLDLIIWLKINRQMCVWEEEGECDCLWELQSAMLLWFQDRSVLIPPTDNSFQASSEAASFSTGRWHIQYTHWIWTISTGSNKNIM